MDEQNIPDKYRPISAFGYFGYNILFSIPLVGFILLIIFALDSSNINRRNYARSFFITILITVIIFIVFMMFGAGFLITNLNGLS